MAPVLLELRVNVPLAAPLQPSLSCPSPWGLLQAS